MPSQQLRLRAVISLYNYKVDDCVRFAYFYVRLVLGRVIASQRRGIIGKLNYHATRAGSALWNLEVIGAH
jgi:hypothetical protein